MRKPKNCSGEGIADSPRTAVAGGQDCQRPASQPPAAVGVIAADAAGRAAQGAESLGHQASEEKV